MAFNFETKLVESISNRCHILRKNVSFNQDDIVTISRMKTKYRYHRL
ncbi:Uncharacterised protein [Streptococcus massiliensis]|uniref:Uncharacterized protein n=1 Tax=Streptococcus massiliensis TaxID=313439 RepID=A0A380L0B3_9STRE|nr:Uncharacterised protein [Streptococcus massiliensis]